jgi:hypothetical protein
MDGERQKAHPLRIWRGHQYKGLPVPLLHEAEASRDMRPFRRKLPRHESILVLRNALTVAHARLGRHGPNRPNLDAPIATTAN